MNLNDFWSFRTMLMSRIVQVAFIIGVIACILGSLIIMSAGISRGTIEDIFLYFLAGFMLLFVGPIFCRIVCEFTIIFFRINETLTEIKNALERDGYDRIERANEQEEEGK
ncbi:MAG: DUF4282 domain-containing protein [Gemmataceae bacterium]|nr:DUF4282 domain-containing protein [Gemmataceae bacterium]